MSKIVKKYMGDLTNNSIPVLSYHLIMRFAFHSKITHEQMEMLDLSIMMADRNA